VSVVFRWHEVGFSSLASHFYCLFFDHLSVCLPFIDRTMWDYFIVITWRPSSINFSHFHLLLENHWTEFNQTLHRCSLWGPTQEVSHVLVVLKVVKNISAMGLKRF